MIWKLHTDLWVVMVGKLQGLEKRRFQIKFKGKFIRFKLEEYRMRDFKYIAQYQQHKGRITLN